MSSVRPELKFSDSSDESSFYKTFLKEFQDKPEKTVRIVDKQDYFIVLQDDADLVAEIIYKTNTVIKTRNYNDHEIKYVTLSPSVLVNFLKLAVFDLGYKVEIYDRKWKLIKNASPGNLVAIDEYISSSDLLSLPMIASLKVVQHEGNKKIGLSYVDQNNKVIGIVEFIDNDIFSNLESVLIQLGINEVLIASPSNESDIEHVRVCQVIDRCNITISYTKSSDFNTKNIEQDLIRLTADELVLTTPSVSLLSLAHSCANAMLEYLQLISSWSEEEVWTLELYQPSNFLKLDYSAVKALNLFDKNDSTNKNVSLFGMLNHCKTIGGTRLLSQWLKQPLVNKEEIEKRLSIVEFLINESSLRMSLQDNVLNKVPDLLKLVKKISKKSSSRSSLNDVIRLYQFVTKLPELLEILNTGIEYCEDENLKALFDKIWISPITEYNTQLIKFQELIESTIDLQALDNATSASQLNQVQVNPEFDPNLMELDSQLKLLQRKIKQEHLNVADDLSMELEKKLKLENHQNHGWCFRLTRTDSSVLRGNKSYKELQTVKAGVFFTTAKLQDLCSQVLEIQAEYDKLSSNLVKEIIEISSTYSPILVKLSICISTLDVLVSFAHVSSYAPIQYTKPAQIYDLNDPNRKVCLVGSRHPILENQDDMSFISNDVEFVKDTKEFHLITGPNMGGKSTYIRQIGVIALMCQIGCFIPADPGSELCIFDSILARVGASDSQLKGASTFMTEMLEMSSILRTATSNSLIIVDELGRGTSTYDGFGLAWSISEHISTKIRAFTLFATHFHELTKLTEKVPSVSNLHVVAHIDDQSNDSEEITLLYKVEPGISDQSFGVHVAEVVKFPQKIISMAKRKATELDEYNDDYTDNKRTKCSTEEILKGNELLKKILLEWKENVKELSDDSEIVKSLKTLVNDKYKDQVENDKFIQEVLCL